MKGLEVADELAKDTYLSGSGDLYKWLEDLRNGLKTVGEVSGGTFK